MESDKTHIAITKLHIQYLLLNFVQFFSRSLFTEINSNSMCTKSDCNWKYIATNFKHFSKWQCSHRVFSALKPEMSLSATRWCLCKTSTSSSSSCLSFTAPSHFNPSVFKSSSKMPISLHSLFKSLFAYRQSEFLNFFFTFSGKIQMKLKPFSLHMCSVTSYVHRSSWWLMRLNTNIVALKWFSWNRLPYEILCKM